MCTWRVRPRLPSAFAQVHVYTHLPISIRLGTLTIPKEVNRKKNNEAEATFLTPANGYGFRFTEMNYLYFF
uniref:Neuronal regeneration-related protein n=1 Tax=Pelusios castaneus TaxID=367368 RepID=A0A8C8R514_9SAUR